MPKFHLSCKNCVNSGGAWKPSSRFGKSYYRVVMLSLMPLATFTLCFAYVLGLLRLINAAAIAPIGYEDEDGFHYGLAVSEPIAVRDER